MGFHTDKYQHLNSLAPEFYLSVQKKKTSGYLFPHLTRDNKVTQHKYFKS